MLHMQYFAVVFQQVADESQLGRDAHSTPEGVAAVAQPAIPIQCAQLELMLDLGMLQTVWTDR